MKKLIILFAVILFSCKPNPGTPEQKVWDANCQIVTIDNCEYIKSYNGGICHKENCSNHSRSTSYQFQITDQDHALLYDGDKLVGRFKFTNTALDSLITKDINNGKQNKRCL